jgi:hypothetical protein
VHIINDVEKYDDYFVQGMKDECNRSIWTKLLSESNIKCFVC